MIKLCHDTEPRPVRRTWQVLETAAREAGSSTRFATPRPCSSRRPLASSLMASTARRTCAALPGHSETVQLSATARLGVSCEPAEGGGSAAPCLHEPFFHFAKGFETMSEQEFAAHSDKKRNGIDPFVQCRIRRVGIDSDWPTVDTELERTATTKTIVDVMSLLGERTVTMIGASLVRQTLGAVQCQLEAGNLRRKHELQWRQWGWSTYSEDSKGCSNFSARFRGP